MGDHKSAEEMATIIKEIYEKKFGGKRRGRFQISRSMFRRIAGRSNLRDAFVQEVADESLDNGYVLIPIDDALVVIEKRVLDNYRAVPKTIAKPYWSGDGDDIDQDEDSIEDDE